ncbi:hypothetical protein Vadar_028006 [Vaccinium darrowii]|uniref:Uncharacterized protein n=1 Tax=Vaccinium darrowii TaxID=229202 RepID=A0ACB7Y3U9_9ERIC|nr:hypothetical protein Vadar_028006 [Vaccinium darrowii]
MGHLIPLYEFAKRLILTHHFSITFIVPNDRPLSPSHKSFLDSLIHTGINYVLLPLVNFNNLSNDVSARTCLGFGNELAFGLEMSEQRFLWVVRSPNDKGALSDVNDQNDPLIFLPDGFLDRTKGLGLVVPSWAPQAQILSHRSTGGFLTHCGWNSTLESVVNGIPLIAWPLYAEQKMNAVILTEDLKVVLRLKVSENGIIERTEIADVVKRLMKGEEGNVVRSRTGDLKMPLRRC